MSTWGLYQWSESLEIDKIHPDDLEAFRKASGNIAVYEKIGIDSGYIVIRSGCNTYRVMGDYFKPLPEPKFNRGDKVEVLGKEDIAIVSQMAWHFQNKEYMYFLTVNNKNKTKRYFEGDLVKINNI